MMKKTRKQRRAEWWATHKAAQQAISNETSHTKNSSVAKSGNRKIVLKGPLKEFAEHPRISIITEVAGRLPDDQKGNISLAAQLLLDLDRLPLAQWLPDQILLNRLAYIADIDRLDLDRIITILTSKKSYVEGGLFIVKCWSCNRKICLKPREDGIDDTFNIDYRWRTSGDRHVCNGMSSGKYVASYGKGTSERVGQFYIDDNDASKGVGQIFRDSGRFGSYPTHDDHGS